MSNNKQTDTKRPSDQRQPGDKGKGQGQQQQETGRRSGEQNPPRQQR